MPVGEKLLHTLCTVSTILSLGFGLLGCGGSGQTDSPSLSMTDHTVSATGTISTNTLADSLSEGGSTSTGLIGLLSRTTNQIADADFAWTKACKANSDGTATVVITRSGAGSKTVIRGKRTFASTVTAGGSETRIWTPPSGQSAITCVNAKAGAAISWGTDTAINGLILKSSPTKTHHIDLTKTVTLTGVSSTQKDYDDITGGTRSTTWTAPSATPISGYLTRDKSIVLNAITTSSIHTQSDGTDITLTTSMSTETAAPLKVLVQRASSSPFALQYKTIKSGTIDLTASDGSLTKTSFASVVYDLTSANTKKCVPTKGTITGSVYTSASATTSSKTFVITFGVSSSDTGVTIAYDGGTASDYDYALTGCDLERDAAGL